MQQVKMTSQVNTNLHSFNNAQTTCDNILDYDTCVSFRKDTLNHFFGPMTFCFLPPDQQGSVRLDCNQSGHG